MVALIYRLSDMLATATAFWVITVGGSISAASVYLWGASDGVLALINLAISIFTMAIAQATLVAGARQSIAVDLKLDRIIESLPGPNDVVGIEKEALESITDLKNQVEERNNDDRPPPPRR